MEVRYVGVVTYLIYQLIPKYRVSYRVCLPILAQQIALDIEVVNKNVAEVA